MRRGLLLLSPISNICTIHDVGETDGEVYIVMELVEGKSLRDLSSDAGLPPESVMR